MSPGAAPPLPSQLKVHFSFCSAKFWLIVESFVSFDPVYPCCCIVCDLPTELSRSHHCLTLTSSGWDTLQKFTILCYKQQHRNLKNRKTPRASLRKQHQNQSNDQNSKSIAHHQHHIERMQNSNCIARKTPSKSKE